MPSPLARILKNLGAQAGLLHSYNLSKVGLYNGTFPYLDVIKSGVWFNSPGNLGGGTANADNWITGLPAGNTAQFPCVYGMGAASGYFPPGNYEAVCSNTNITLSLSSGSAGISNLVSGAGNCTFTVSDVTGQTPTWDSFYITITALNNSGSPQNILDLRVNLISDRTDILAGKIFKQSYINALLGAKVLRIHDLYAFDSGGVASERYFSNYNQTLTKRAYSGDAGVASNGIHNGIAPVAVMCEIAQRVGARPWFNLPVGMCNYGYGFDHASGTFHVLGGNPEAATTVTIPHRFIEGERLRSFSYRSNPALGPTFANDTDVYVKNATTTTFQLSATKFGSVVPVASAAATLNTTGTFSTGSATITALASTVGISIGSVARSASIPSGVGIVTAMSGTQVTLDMLDGSPASVVGATGVAITFNGDLDTYALGYSSIASLDIDFMTDMVNPFLNAIKTAWPTCKPMFEPSNEIWNFIGFPTYRWAQHIGSVLAGDNTGSYPTWLAWFLLHLWVSCETIFGHGNYTIIHPGQGQYFANMGGSFDFVDPGIRRTGVTLKQQYIDALAADTDPNIPSVVYAFAAYLGKSASTVPTSFNGATFVEAYSDNGNSTVIPDSYWDGRFNAEITWKLGTVPADISAAQAKVPNIKFVAYEWGHQISESVNNANDAAVAKNFQTYLDGVAGKNMYKRFWDQTIAPNANLWYCLNHYSGYGGRTLTYVFYSWNICDMRLIDNARSTWYKTV